MPWAADQGYAMSRKRPDRIQAGPLYMQVVNVLKDEILKGAYPINTQLPSEDRLCQRFDVSRHTVREALRRLREDGLVSSRKGAGTMVVRPGRGKSYIHEVASINDLITFVAALKFRVDTMRTIVANRALVKRIGGADGQQWLKLEGYRYLAGKKSPVCWMEVFVHTDYAGVARLLEQHEGPIFELIENLYGESIAEVEQILRTSPMPKKVAEDLGVEPGAASIEIHRIFRLASGKIAEVSIAHYRAESFSFSLKLRRTRGSA
jgi:GntR family transcriptional regulator